MRLIPALLVAALVPVLAGCGSTGVAGSAASAVPEEVAAYVSVDTSFEGGQWRAVRDLLARFPDGEGALDELLDEAAREAGLAGGDGLKDALGAEVGIAVLELPQAGGEPPVVLLTRPADEDAFRRLVEEGEAASAEVEGWQAVASDEATLERYREALDGGPSLESSSRFQETMDDLDPDALVHAYVNGESITAALGSQPGLPMGALPLPSGVELGSIGAVLEAESDGLRVEGRAVLPEPAEAPSGETYRSELVEEIPGGVLAFVSVNGLGKGLESAAGVAQGFLPFDAGEIAELLAEETAVYVRPGTPEPSVTLVTQVEDEAAALETVEGLVGLAGPNAGTIAYEAFDGLLAVSTSQAEIDALRGGGPRLDQDDAFEDAAEQAGLPDETTGFGYVDLQALVPLVLGLGPAATPRPSEVGEYLEPLGSVVFWGGKSGDVQDFSLFLGIE